MIAALWTVGIPAVLLWLIVIGQYLSAGSRDERALAGLGMLFVGVPAVGVTLIWLVLAGFHWLG